MMTITSRARLAAPIIIALFSFAYVSWQLIGIRFENHDDIYFHLYSHVFSGDYLKFADETAYLQARIQAYVNMPLSLWINSLQASAWFDVVNLSVFAVLYLAIITFLASIVEKPNAFILPAVVALVFPLHYYFTFPQGYPIMGPYGLALALLSASLLASYLRKPSKVKLFASAIFFTVSLWGPEYNFILHPIFLFMAWLAAAPDRNLKSLCSLAWPYALGILLTIGVYLAFSMFSRQSGGDAYGRVSLGFNFSAWMKTFFALQENAFLPIGLLKGVTMTGATAQGVPKLPAAFNYQAIWDYAGDWRAVVAVFMTFLLASLTVFRCQEFSRKSLTTTAVFFFVVATFPALIVSASSHYQTIVLARWVQGHLATFYSHLGLAGLSFLLCVAAIKCAPRQTKPLIVLAGALLLSAYATVTFIYNNANRQAMMANRQRWDAMELFASYIQAERPDLLASKFYAPGFWSVTGVSSIPADNPASGVNYWTQYCEAVLKQKLSFVNESLGADRDGTAVTYFSLPNGNPVVYFEEQRGGALRQRTMLSLRPAAGVLVDSGDGSPIKQIVDGDWTCEKYCVANLPVSRPGPSRLAGFRQNDLRPRNVIAQFFLPRYAGFGSSLANDEGVTSLKIENWGPREAELGMVPNPQPDGNAGLWIKLSEKQTAGALRVLVDGIPANATSVTPELITASIAAEVFKTAGEKQLVIFDPQNGSTVFVGKLTVKTKQEH